MFDLKITNATLPDGRTNLDIGIKDGRIVAIEGNLEGEAGEAALDALRDGVVLKDGLTRPAEVERIDAPDLWPRVPPIRVRASIPDCWLRITIREGRNRQVRRMTAAVGHPTLRLVRWSVGDWSIDGLAPGEWRSG